MADKNNAAAAVKPATRAYVTLLANDDDGADDSFNGVVRLAKGLRSAGSAYPLVVAVLPDVPEFRRRVLMDELGCVVLEVQPVDPLPLYYNKLRVWEFMEYDQMMYLDATGFQGSLENIHEKFEPDGGLPPVPCVDDDMFVYKPSMATARLLRNAIADLMRMRPRTTIADLVMMGPRTTTMDDYHGDVMTSPPRTTTIADQQQAPAAASSSSRQQSSDGVTTSKQWMTVFFMAVVAVVTMYLHNY